VKNRKVKIIIGLIIGLLLIAYLTGTVSQVLYGFSIWRNTTAGDGIAGMLLGNTEPVDRPPLFEGIGRPLPVIRALFSIPHNLHAFIIVIAVVTVIVIFLTKNSKVQGDLDTDRNLILSNKGTHGTAGWMGSDRMSQVLEVTKDLKRCRGTILGEKDGHVINIPENKHADNRNLALYGASGTGKSVGFVRNMVFQSVRRGESLVITDPKSELYASMAEYLRGNGYIVKVFNLISPQNSDNWNCLKEIEGGNVEEMAHQFANAILLNTLKGAAWNPFWDETALALLKSLCLYVVLIYPEEKRTIGEVFNLLAGMAGGEGDLDARFALLEFGHPAKTPYSIFAQSAPAVKQGTITGLANKISLFGVGSFPHVLGYSEDGMDLELPGKQKCAYFCIVSDRDPTFHVLSSLFMTFIFMKLMGYADSLPGQRLPVPVHILGDEILNIGTIPDFGVKMATIRSRLISASIIIQNLPQIQNRYPDTLWEDLLSHCDWQIFLGCNEMTTATYISDYAGDTTVGIEGEMVERSAVRMSNWKPSYRETISVGQRKLLTPDEVRRLRSDGDILIFVTGEKPLKARKFPFWLHPEYKSKHMIEVNSDDHIPAWRKKTEGGRVIDIITGEVIEEINFATKVASPKRTADVPAEEPIQAVKATRARKKLVVESSQSTEDVKPIDEPRAVYKMTDVSVVEPPPVAAPPIAETVLPKPSPPQLHNRLHQSLPLPSRPLQSLTQKRRKNEAVRNKRAICHKQL